MSEPLFIITYHGDLDGPMRAYPSFDAALAEIAGEFGTWDETPDPEDDRIVVWEARAGSVLRAIWHFSGWHWDSSAVDLPGGPLDQGCLPGRSYSLYDLAMDEDEELETESA